MSHLVTFKSPNDITHRKDKKYLKNCTYFQANHVFFEMNAMSLVAEATWILAIVPTASYILEAPILAVYMTGKSGCWNGLRGFLFISNVALRVYCTWRAVNYSF